MKRRTVVAILASSAVAFSLLPSCLGATKITLDVRTDVACSRVRGVAIAAGEVGQAERASPAAVTRACDGAGRVGTLVITPRSDAGVTAIKVVMGVNVDVSQCTADTNYRGCIVQRRELAFIENEALEVPIDLIDACVDVPCEEHSTCAKDGRCVPAKITNSESCTPPNRCYPAGDVATNADGGLDANSSDANDNDGNPANRSDASTGSDAGNENDANLGSDTGGGGFDASGGVPAFCPPPAGQGCYDHFCCFSKATDTGECRSTCEAVNYSLQCTHRGSCSAEDYCCMVPAAPRAQCGATCTEYLCLNASDCPPSRPTCSKDGSFASPVNGWFGRCVP